jgi:chromosome segregation ATPase
MRECVRNLKAEIERLRIENAELRRDKFCNCGCLSLDPTDHDPVDCQFFECAAEAAGKPMPTTNELENVLAFAAADTHCGDTTAVCSEACEACKTLAREVERLKTQIHEAWTMLAYYGTDSCADLAEEGEFAEDVTLVTGIDQLGDMACQWRDERDQQADKIERLKAENDEYQRQFDGGGYESLETLLAKERGLSNRLQNQLETERGHRQADRKQVEKETSWLQTIDESLRRDIQRRDAEMQHFRKLLIEKDAEGKRRQTELDTLHDNILELLPNAVHLRSLADELEADSPGGHDKDSPILQVWADRIDKLHTMIPAAAVVRRFADTEKSKP